jgi:L-ascorbate metabolism protein UlaG (beta-lactamase superfamily)
MTLPWTTGWLGYRLPPEALAPLRALDADGLATHLAAGTDATSALALELLAFERAHQTGGSGQTTWNLPRALQRPDLPAEQLRLRQPLSWSASPGRPAGFDGPSDGLALVVSDDWAVCLDSARMNAYHREGTLHLALGPEARDVERAHAELMGLDKPSALFQEDEDGLRLDPEVYFRATPSIVDDDLAVLFHRRDDAKEIRVAVGADGLAFFGELLPLLRRTNGIADVQQRVGAQRWAMVDKLMQAGVLEVTPRTEPLPREGYRARFVAHSAVLLESPTHRVLVDPMLLVRQRPTFDPMHHLDEPVDAVFITHCHWDHFTLDGLLHLDRGTPILLPARSHPESIVNLDMARVCRELGFTNVVSLDPWEAYAVGDITMTAVPYFGEGFGPECPRDWMTFHGALGGKTVLGLVDACHDDFGTMDDVLDALHERLGPADVLFSPASGFEYPRNHFTRRPFHRSDARTPFTGTPADTARWADKVGASTVVPYALFHLTPADHDDDEAGLAADPFRTGSVRQVVELLGDRAVPLRPGEALAWSEQGPARPIGRDW